MDIEPRIATAFAIMALMVILTASFAIRYARRRRADKLRRRGIKNYNRTGHRAR